MQYAIRWQKVNHAYNTVYDLVDWAAPGEKWAHKSCKGVFFKDAFLQDQPRMQAPIGEVHEIPPCTPVDHVECMSAEENIRRSTGKQLAYTSSW
ncbi:MAG: hypothetical protein ABW185_07785 [Sedimenticola sp.]